VDRRRAYLDTSVILRRLLRHPDALKGLTGWDLVASDLMEVEALRTLYRVHSEGLLSDDVLGARMAELREGVAALEQFPITKSVLRRAGGPFPGILKALDAIHLATALLWSEHFGENVVMITHDRQLARVARASGLEVYPWPMPTPSGPPSV
jgi:predicted nucleic acid-binding protein